MPIDRAKMQEPQAPIEDRVVAFLRGAPEWAFTPFEIACGLVGQDVTKMAVSAALLLPEGQKEFCAPYVSCLKKLEADGTVTSAIVQESRYYALVDVMSEEG